MLGIGHGERRDGKLLLSSDMQCGAAGHQHFEPGTASQQRCYLDGSPDHLLKVVQQQQEIFLSQRGTHQVEQRLTWGLFEEKRLSNGGRDQPRIADGGQVHEIDAIAELLQEFGCHLQAQTGFAGATRSRKREQAHVFALEQVSDSGHLPLASNQWCELDWQVMGVDIERPQGRKIGRQGLDDQLVEVGGMR